MKNETGNIFIVLILVVVVVLLAFWYFTRSSYKLPGETAQNSIPAVQDKVDLNSASNELDGTDLNQMDADLNQLSSDSASF